MVDKKCFEIINYLKNILRGNNQQSTEENCEQSKRIFKEQLFSCKNNFSGKVSRHILIVKAKLFQLIQQLEKNLPEVLQKNQTSIIKFLCIKLNSLNSDHDFLLKEGILTLYMDIYDLKQKMKQKCQNKIQDFLNLVIDSLENLLRCFFVYKQYHVQRLKQDKIKYKNVLSLRNLNQDKQKQIEKERNTLDEKLISEVEQQFANKLIYELIDNYMKNEEVRMKQTLQICRICSNQIKIQSIEKHVKNCQRKFILKQQLEQKIGQYKKILERLKQDYQKINQKSEKNEEEQNFRRIAKVILSIDIKRQRRLDRRSSLIGFKSSKNIKNMIQTLIQQYLQNSQEHETLKEILALLKAKALIEKKINVYQINNLHSENNTQTQKEETKDQSVSLKKQLIISTSKNHKSNHHKSKFHQKLQKNLQLSDSCSSIEDQSPDSASQQKSQFSVAMQTFKTKNSISRKKILDQIQVNDEQLVKNYVSLQNISFASQSEHQITLQSFKILKNIGSGAFGRVYLARRSETKDLYALKVVKIQQNCGEEALETIKNEHQIFRKIAGDHLVRAPFSFSQKASHIFILQYLPGGDLRKILTEQVYFDDEKARFYLAQIILAIEHLHKFQIIHRDLKPENLVIDRNGHLKLTDFGLSEFQIKNKLEKAEKMQKQQQQEKKQKRKTWRRRAGVHANNIKPKLIGTPDYIAPEIINNLSVKNFTIDWWSLGIIAYEFMIGTTPFSGQTIENVIDNITKFHIDWPQQGYQEGMISPEAKDLICQLLNRDFVNRLGANGADQIKAHPFFDGVDWANIKTARPPLVPKIQNLNKYFDIEQNSDLRKQIDQMIGINNSPGKPKGQIFKLQKFIRFDLLGSETIELAEKVVQSEHNKLQKLKTIHKLHFEEEQSLNSKQITEE